MYHIPSIRIAFLYIEKDQNVQDCVSQKNITRTVRVHVVSHVHQSHFFGLQTGILLFTDLNRWNWTFLVLHPFILATPTSIGPVPVHQVSVKNKKKKLFIRSYPDSRTTQESIAMFKQCERLKKGARKTSEGDKKWWGKSQTVRWRSHNYIGM